MRSNAEALGRTLGGAVGHGRRHSPAEFARRRLDARVAVQRRAVGPATPGLVRTSLKDYRKVRRVHGGTVNDVILATLSGAIRAWLMTRAESVGAGRRLRALVPMSVIDEELEPTSLGSQVVGHLVDLPIGEGSPVVRLHQVSYALRAHSETGRAVAADRIAGVAGFAPTTFHSLGSRVAFKEARGSVNLVITNVPGPQFPMYLAGAEMVETYPVPPLFPRVLAVGRRHVVRRRGLLRHQRRSRRACPTSRCSASACARRSTSSSTAPATAGCARRAGASAPRSHDDRPRLRAATPRGPGAVLRGGRHRPVPGARATPSPSGCASRGPRPTRRSWRTPS